MTSPTTSLLSTVEAPTCAADDAWCRAVLKATGNEWLATAADWLVAKPLAVIMVLLIAFAARWFLHRMIDRVTTRAAEGLPTPVLKHKKSVVKEHSVAVVAGRRVQRAQTMGSLLKSIASIVIFTIAGITILAEIGVAVGPLIASAGIVGVAIGFGAQSLVSDFLSGIFMIIEDQYGVGDAVDLGEAIGTVEAVGLRVTRLRDVEGTVWYVRNGEILRVGNQSQNWARTVVDVPVSHEQDLYRVQAILKDVAHEVWEDEDFRKVIIEEPEVWGVQEMTPDWITVRVTLKTAPLEQWGVAREMRERIKARFDHLGIELARPARVIIHRDHAANPGNGAAQPAATGAGREGAPDGGSGASSTS
jgi:small conductance mechanosensitive channel